MTKFVLSRPGAPWDYATLGFTADADGAILDGTLFDPDLTIPPDAYWSVYEGVDAETDITRYATPNEAFLDPTPEITAGWVLAYDTDANTFVPTAPTVLSLVWTADTVVSTGDVRQAPDGSWIKSTGNRTTRPTFDATEATFWEAVLASSGTVEATALTAAIDTAATDGSLDAVRFSTDTDALVISDTLGLDGRRLRIAPHDQATSAAGVSIELVPGDTLNPATQTPSQILLYNQSGTNYERFTLTAHADQYLIESTFNGTGSAKDILFQVGGSVSEAIDGVSALVIYNDASVDLQGGTFAADGVNWGATKTRIADPGNTGDCRLIIDTRTGTPADNAADTASLEFRRGGSAKWNVGLNYAGGNTDALDFWSRDAGANRMQLLETGELLVRGDAPNDYGATLRLVNTGTSGHEWRIGEFGGASVLAFRDVSTGAFPLKLGSAGGFGTWGVAPPATQPATPVTLADVITALQAYGIVA